MKYIGIVSIVIVLCLALLSTYLFMYEIRESRVDN